MPINWLIPYLEGGLGVRLTPLSAADAVRALRPGDGLVVEGLVGALFISAALHPAGRFVVQPKVGDELRVVFLEDPTQPDGEADTSLSGEPARPFPRRLLCDRAAVEQAAVTMAATGELDGRLCWWTGRGGRPAEPV